MNGRGVNRWTRKQEPNKSADQMIEQYGLHRWREVAEEASDAVIAYRDWYLSTDDGYQYDEPTADNIVDRAMEGESVKVRKRVLDVALALAMEDGVELTSLQREEIRRRRVA